MVAINKQCNLHLCKSLPENEPVYTLTAKRYDTFIEYTRRWSTLCKYPEKTVALANSRYLELTFEQAGELYWAIPFNIGTPPIEGSGNPMGGRGLNFEKS